MNIRSYADWATIFHVFGREEYGLKNGYWLAKIQNEYQRILETGRIPLIVDCGSNIAAASNFFALKFPKAKVLGYEISEANHIIALRNSLPGIVQFHQGLASRSGTAHVEDNGLGFNGLRLGTELSKAIEIVATISMEDVLKDVSDQGMTPLICKIDIEGGEADLFSGQTSAFNLFPVIVMEPHDWLIPGKNISLNFMKFHTSKSRELVIQGENAWSLSATTSR